MKERERILLVRIACIIAVVTLLLFLFKEQPLFATYIALSILIFIIIVIILRWIFLVNIRMILLADIKDELKQLNKVNDEIKESLISIKQRIYPEPNNDKKDEMGVIKNIRVKCPNCPYFFNMPKEYLERKIKCPKCKQEFFAKKQLVL